MQKKRFEDRNAKRTPKKQSGPIHLEISHLNKGKNIKLMFLLHFVQTKIDVGALSLLLETKDTSV